MHTRISSTALIVGAFATCVQFSVSGTAAAGLGSDDRVVDPREWAASVRWENDLFGGTDRFYTDGVALGVTHTGPSWVDPLVDWLPWGEGRRTVGYDLTQAMLTPADTSRSVPDPTDRPYAGILSFGISLHVAGSNSCHGLRLVAGVVGPWSFAEETQREVHRLVGSGLPEGWSHQLKNEPLLDLAYEYRHRFRMAGRREAWLLEILPSAGGAVGNALTQLQLGGLVRFGYNVPDDFGVTLVRGLGQMPPPRRRQLSEKDADWGFSVYCGGFGNLVLQDITLDGNLWHDGPGVDKRPLVPAGGLGMSVGNRRFLAAFTYVFWGEEFNGQKEHSEFGAIALSYFF